MKGIHGALILLTFLCLLVTADWVDHSGDHLCYCSTDAHCATLHNLPPQGGYILRGDLR